MSVEAAKAREIADADREITRLWRAWRTVHEMVQDRVSTCPFSQYFTLIVFYQGYELSEEEVHVSLDAFRHEYAQDGNIESVLLFPKPKNSTLTNLFREQSQKAPIQRQTDRQHGHQIHSTPDALKPLAKTRHRLDLRRVPA